MAPYEGNHQGTWYISQFACTAIQVAIGDMLQAEDARMLGEVAVARKLYTQLQHLNRYA